MNIKDFQSRSDRYDIKVLKVGDADRNLLSSRIKYIIDNYDVFEELVEGNLDEHFDAYTEGFCRCYYLKGMTRNFACYSEWFQAIWYKMNRIGEDPLKAYWRYTYAKDVLWQLLNHVECQYDLRIRKYTFIRDFIDVIFFSVCDRVNAQNGDPNPVRDLWFMEDFSF